MGQTFVALYDSPETAHKAALALHKARFTDGEVRVVTPADFEVSQPLETDILGISGMVKPDIGVYEEAVRRGDSLVAVTSANPDAARAEAVLLGFQPVQLDQKVAQWQTAGWKNPYDELPTDGSMQIFDHERAQTGRDGSPATVRVFVW